MFLGTKWNSTLLWILWVFVYQLRKLITDAYTFTGAQDCSPTVRRDSAGKILASVLTEQAGLALSLWSLVWRFSVRISAAIQAILAEVCLGFLQSLQPNPSIVSLPPLRHKIFLWNRLLILYSPTVPPLAGAVWETDSFLQNHSKLFVFSEAVLLSSRTLFFCIFLFGLLL
jgi:hypothetical protein